MVRSTHLHLQQIAQLRSCLDVGLPTTLVHALVVSRLELQCFLHEAAFETDAEVTNGPEHSRQIINWGEKTPAYFPHSGGLTLITHLLPH